MTFDVDLLRTAAAISSAWNNNKKSGKWTSLFLSTLVALDPTPDSQWLSVSEWAEFRGLRACLIIFEKWFLMFMSDEGKPDTSCNNKQYLKVFGLLLINRNKHEMLQK